MAEKAFEALKHDLARLRAAGKHADALTLLEEWIDTHPAVQPALVLYFNLCMEQKAGSRIHIRLLHWVERFPTHTAFVEVLRVLEQALNLNSKPPSDYIAELVTLRKAGKLDAMTKLLDEAIQRYPNVNNFYRLRGSLRLAYREFSEAKADYAKALQLAPDQVALRNAIAVIELTESNCTEGFENYSWRKNKPIDVVLPWAKLPRWQGEPLKGKSLLIVAEQGVGDIIMWSTLLPWLISEGATITLAMFGKLIPLFARSFPEIRVIPMLSEMPDIGPHDCDAYTLMGELMRYILPHYSPSEHAATLRPDADMPRELGARMRKAAEARGKQRLVGISWHTVNEDSGFLRNIPLADWAPILNAPGVQCVSLQYGDHRAEIAEVNQCFPGAIWLDDTVNAYDNTDQLAAQIAALDEVISIQNATVHLAGAMGIPARILLSTASDWRWGLTATNRWYGSVQIVRQATPCVWQPEIASIAAAFEANTPKNA